MAKDPAFPWYASDWLGSNRRATMSLEQQGAYMVLLCRQWSDKTCSLPDDDEALARLSELNEGWFTGGSQVLRPCFPKHPNTEGRVANPKLLKVREERDEWIEKSREGGLKSGATRRAKAKQPKTCDDRRVVEPPHEPNANQTRTKREPNVNSPSPSPSPSLLKKNPLNPPKGKVVVTEDIDTVIGHYRSHHPNARPGAKERKLIAARLKEGYIVEDLCVAIDGCHRSAYHAGQNKDATVYQSLELIVRDSKHVQQFLEVPAEPLKPVIQTAPSVLDRISTLGKGDRS